MKRPLSFTSFFVLTIFATIIFTGCSQFEKAVPANTDQLDANKKMYSRVCDDILNKGRIEMFNDSNRVKNVLKVETKEREGSELIIQLPIA